MTVEYPSAEDFVAVSHDKTGSITKKQISPYLRSRNGEGSSLKDDIGPTCSKHDFRIQGIKNKVSTRVNGMMDR
jgi:hypothetical protein